MEWVIDLLKISLKDTVHIFCLDFSSALLANIIHSPQTLSYLEHNQDLAKKLLEDLLLLVNSKIPVSVLMHVLIAVSYLNRECFEKILKEVNFTDQIQKLIMHYS